MTDELSVKVVLVGASGSGKTSITSQFMDDEFALENNSTAREIKLGSSK